MESSAYIICIGYGAAAAIWSVYARRFWYTYTKPIPVFLVLVTYIVRLESAHPVELLFAFGLFLGLMGDILLLRKSLFIPGLLSFMGGHLAYVVAFVWQPMEIHHWRVIPLWAILLYLSSGVVAGLYFFRHLMRTEQKKYIVAVFIYMGVSTSLLLAAHNFEIHPQFNPNPDGYPLILFGAYLFVISDIILAYDKFIGRFKAASFLILSTYYSAQAAMAAGMMRAFGTVLLDIQ